MKVRADEHISPKIVRAVQAIALSDGWDLTHVRDFNSARTADETWIPRFVLEGGQVILSADRRILSRPHQLLAISEGNLIGVFLPAKWAEARGHAQAAHILWWWPRIEAAIKASKPKQCWRVPYEFGEANIEEITINYEEALRSRIR